jgi:hypothetical protein
LGKNEGWLADSGHTRRAVDFVHEWSGEVPVEKRETLKQIGIGASKFYDWESRYGQDNQHNGQIPREGWLEEWEQEAILRYYDEHPGKGYRRLSYMMLDAEVVAVSPVACIVS